MKALLLQIAAALFKQLQPLIVDEIRKLLPDIVAAVKGEIPELTHAVATEIEKQMPAITKALVTAVAQAVSGAVVRGEDKFTDMIPGTMDDAILDPIVANAMDIFRNTLGGFFR